MAERLGLKLGKWLYHKGQVEENQIDMIRYSFEIICSEITEIMIIIGYGLLTDQMLYTLMYLFFFHTLRHFFQGYYAKIIFRCLILTVGAYLISLIGFSYLTYGWGFIFLIISLLLQVEYCIRNHQMKSFLVVMILWGVTFLYGFLTKNLSVIQLFLVVDFIVSVSLLPERRTHEA